MIRMDAQGECFDDRAPRNANLGARLYTQAAPMDPRSGSMGAALDRGGRRAPSP